MDSSGTFVSAASTGSRNWPDIASVFRSGGVAQLVQSDRILLAERANARAAQSFDMTTAAKTAADVAGQRAHVSPLAAFSLENGCVSIGRFNKAQFLDNDESWPRLDQFTFARQARLPSTLMAENEEALQDLAGELSSSASISPLVGRLSERAITSPSASSVAVSSPQRTVKLIGLLAIDRERDRLGRLAKGNGKNASCQRIERPGMAGLLCLIDALHRTQRLGRCGTQRLIQNGFHP